MENNIPTLFTKGGVPNSLVRSALFSTKSLGDDRSMVKAASIYSQNGYEITYTGEELNQFDCQTLHAILHAQRDSGLPFGRPVTVSQTAIIELLSKDANGNTYKRVYNQIRRICEATLCIKQSVHESSRVYHGHIIDRFWKDDRGHLCFTLNPDLASLFDADCTILSLQRKVLVDKLMSKWLLDYSSSHTQFIPLPVDYLKSLSGNINPIAQFKRQLAEACDEIIEKLGSKAPFVRYNITKTTLNLYKKNATREISSSKAKAGEEGFNPYD